MSEAPSPFERMRADHRHVLRALIGLERAASSLDTGPASAQRELQRSLGTLELQFATHMAAEDDIVFPILLNALPSTAANVASLRTEHDDLRSMLSRLESTLAARPSKARNEQLRVQVCDFVDLLRIHVRKEEAVAFRLAEKLIGPNEGARLSERLDRPGTKGRKP